jgi:cellulose synthase/poly-beta-1,6-N-acetylglucosamine synthase-like glycosyltransferase
MPSRPMVDINLFVYNGVKTVGAAIESVLAQSWPNIGLTLIDDGSTDGTFELLRDYAARHPAIQVKRNRCNGGAIASFQRAFWSGDADYVMPKSGDDVISPDFVERLMEVLLEHPNCAMAHAAGLIFRGAGDVQGYYPPEHCLTAIGSPTERSCKVMTTYTSSPSFWGVYRRAAVDRLSPIRYRAGWDHVLLAELALYGEIRHVPTQLYWRRDGGKPVLQLARAATAQAHTGLSLDDSLAEQRWRTPLITTAYAHMEMAADSRLSGVDRLALMREVPAIFRARWLPRMQHEATAFRADLPAMLTRLRAAEPVQASWMARSLIEAVQGVAAIVPEINLTADWFEITALACDWPDQAAGRMRSFS